MDTLSRPLAAAVRSSAFCGHLSTSFGAVWARIAGGVNPARAPKCVTWLVSSIAKSRTDSLWAVRASRLGVAIGLSSSPPLCSSRTRKKEGTGLKPNLPLPRGDAYARMREMWTTGFNS